VGVGLVDQHRVSLSSRVATPQDHNDPVYPVNSCFTQISDRTKTILFVTIFHWGCTKSPENSKSLPCSQKFLSIPGLWPPYQVTPQTAKSPLWCAYISPIYIVPTLITVRIVQQSNKNNRWPLIHTVVVTFDVQLNIIECFSSRRHIIHLLTLNERLHITHTYASTL